MVPFRQKVPNRNNNRKKTTNSIMGPEFLDLSGCDKSSPMTKRIFLTIFSARDVAKSFRNNYHASRVMHASQMSFIHAGLKWFIIYLNIFIRASIEGMAPTEQTNRHAIRIK